MPPKVSCLMATHGRISVAAEALACFLAQDYQGPRELILLNNHPTPIRFRHPLVRVFNEPGPWETLGDIRQRMLDLATGDLVRSWDDDDLYMPWAIRQGVEGIGDSGAVAFKPIRSWHSQGGPHHFVLCGNNFEPSITIRAEVARKAGFAHVTGDEHRLILNEIARRGGGNLVEMGVLTGFVYRWGWGRWHATGMCNRDGADLENHMRTWKIKNDDAGDGVSPMEPADVTGYWRALLRHVREKHGPEDSARMEHAFEESGVQL